MTAFAVRQRSFSDPHPVADIQADAIKRRKDFEAKRSAEIQRLMEETPGTDRYSATLMYDLELAPSTTGRAILLEHGIVSSTHRRRIQLRRRRRGQESIGKLIEAPQVPNAIGAEVDVRIGRGGVAERSQRDRAQLRLGRDTMVMRVKVSQ